MEIPVLALIYRPNVNDYFRAHSAHDAARHPCRHLTEPAVPRHGDTARVERLETAKATPG